MNNVFGKKFIAAVTILSLSTMLIAVSLMQGTLSIRVHSESTLVQANPLLKMFMSNASEDSILKALKEHPEYIKQNLGNGTPLYYACGEQQEAVVHFLLNNGADPDFIPAGERNAAIVVVISTKNRRILEEFLGHGANRTVKDSWGRTLPELARDVGWPEGEHIIMTWPAARGAVSKP